MIPNLLTRLSFTRWFNTQILSLQEELHQAKCANIDSEKKDRSSHDDLNQENDVTDTKNGLLEELLGAIGIGKKKTDEKPVTPLMVNVLMSQLIDERAKHVAHILSHHDIELDHITSAALLKVSIAEFVTNGAPVQAVRAQFDKLWKELSAQNAASPNSAAQRELMDKLRAHLHQRAKEEAAEREAKAAAEGQTVTESSSVTPEQKYQPPSTQTIPGPAPVPEEAKGSEAPAP